MGNEFVHFKFHITSGYVLDMFSDIHILLTVVWYLVYNEYCTWHTTSDDEQIIIISHLILQVYCSPSLKEYLHNPVMRLLACNMERRVSILHAHGGVCACVCVCVCGGCMCIHIHVYVLHVHGCVVVCACTLVCAFVSAIRTVDTNLQVCVHVSVTTQLNAHKHLTIAHYFFMHVYS